MATTSHKKSASAPAALPTPAAPPRALDLRNASVIAWHSLREGELRRATSALVAVEQLLRVPVPDDSEADSGNLRHVWRDDLAELLGLIGSTLQDKGEELAAMLAGGLGIGGEQ